MFRSVFILFLFACFVIAGSARAQIDHGATGTANHDYFMREANPQLKWLINDIETYHLKPALRNYAEGNIKQAMSDIDYVLVRIVNHPQALSLAIVLSKAAKNSAWANRYFQHALNLYPQYALTYAQYGKYLLEISQAEVAIEKLKKAVEIDPKLTAGYVWLAEAYLKSGNASLAREAADKARSLGYRGSLSQFGL